MDAEVWQGMAIAILGIVFGTFGELLVEDRSNTDSMRLLGRVLRLVGLALLIGGVVVAALAYVFPAGGGSSGL